MIFIVDNVITGYECDLLMKLHSNNLDLSVKFPEDCNKGCSWPILFDKLNDNDLTEIIRKIENVTQYYFGDVEVEWGELKMGDIENSHKLHYDLASELTVVSSITYLNDNYVGGKTIFEDGTEIQPKVGRTVIFDGNRYKHGASTNREYQRYTIPIWYQKK